MHTVENELKRAAKGLFGRGEIDVLVGHSKGTLPLVNRPCLVKSSDEVDRLVWDPYCLNNLAVYLPRFFDVQGHGRNKEETPRVGIVAKGCDIRAVVGLVKERQVPREKIVIIGVPCDGMVDRNKVAAMMNGASISAREERPEGMLLVTAKSGATKSVKKDQVMIDACAECQHPVPDGADVAVEGDAKGVSEQKYAKVDEFEAMSPEERWRYFEDEISRCIRCYACRQACPNCYCKVCFADQTKPRWIGAGTHVSDVMLYHIGRIFHQAGRCVECDACVRACPMDIDLGRFTQKLAKDVKELFDYTPGLPWDEQPPLCTYKEDDSQSFITEP